MAWFKDKGLKKLKNALFLVFLGFVRTMQEKENFLGSFVFSGKNDVYQRETKWKVLASSFFFSLPKWWIYRE